MDSKSSTTERSDETSVVSRPMPSLIDDWSDNEDDASVVWSFEAAEIGDACNMCFRLFSDNIKPQAPRGKTCTQCLRLGEYYMPVKFTATNLSTHIQCAMGHGEFNVDLLPIICGGGRPGFWSGVYRFHYEVHGRV